MFFKEMGEEIGSIQSRRRKSKSNKSFSQMLKVGNLMGEPGGQMNCPGSKMEYSSRTSASFFFFFRSFFLSCQLLSRKDKT